ncbi:MAG TPA: hypothetical protein VEK08_10720 [Planctomycetota bacterium]|nr:hypothetical protein [Planctomycetota bacterium]
MRLGAFGAMMLSLCLLAGCGNGSKQDIIGKIEKASTVDEVKAKLGKPDKYDVAELPVLGKTETLTYKASDGEVIVTAQNGKVLMKVSGDKK